MSLQTETAVERPTGEPPHVDAKPDWKVAFKRAVAKFSLDQCTNTAASLTYFAVFSLFPAVAALVAIITLRFETSQIMEVIVDISGKPASELSAVQTILNNFAESSGAGFALVVGVLTSLWSASGYVSGFSAAMNRIYDVAEGRPVLKLRAWLYLVTAVIGVGILLIFGAVALSGDVARTIGDRVGLGSAAVDVFNIAKWPVVALIVVLIIGLLYWATPNVRKPRRLIFSWGALIAFVLIIVASIGFGLYVSLSAGASYQKTFGPFATAVLFLFYLYIINNVLLFGAELDAELERTRQLKEGLPAEELILLPVRDDKGITKQVDKLESLIDEAHELRLSSGKDIDDLGTPYTPLDQRPRSSERAAALVSSTGRADRQGTRNVDATGGRRRARIDENGRAHSVAAPGSTVRSETSRRGFVDSAVSDDLSSLERAHRDVAAERAVRRDGFLASAASERKVRARLEAQEKKAEQARKKAEKEAEERRQAQQPSREERWAQVEQTRERYAPRDSVQQAAIRDERRGRRQEWEADQRAAAARKAEIRAAAQASPSTGATLVDLPDESDQPMPSELRTQVETERAERRQNWFTQNPPRPPEDVPLKFRRDRRS